MVNAFYRGAAQLCGSVRWPLGGDRKVGGKPASGGCMHLCNIQVGYESLDYSLQLVP